MFFEYKLNRYKNFQVDCLNFYMDRMMVSMLLKVHGEYLKCQCQIEIYYTCIPFFGYIYSDWEKNVFSFPS